MNPDRMAREQAKAEELLNQIMTEDQPKRADEPDIRVGDIVMYSGPRASNEYCVIKINRHSNTAHIRYANAPNTGYYVAKITSLIVVKRPSDTSSAQQIKNKEGESKMNKLIENYLEEKGKELRATKTAALKKVYDNNVFSKLQAKHVKEFNDKVVEVFGEESRLIVDYQNTNDEWFSKKERAEIDNIHDEYVNNCKTLQTLGDKVQTLLDMTNNFEQAERILKEYGIL